MYYLVKQGVYQQGVFWIGDNYEQAIAEATHHALNDSDDYHTWDIKKYIDWVDGLDHDVMFSIDKAGALALKAPIETVTLISGSK
jgi:hypothetical protein